MGGRIGPGMKRAGFDAFMVTGRSETPVWINVIDGKVTIEDATDLMELDAWDTQIEIQKRVAGVDVGEWYDIEKTDFGGSTMQRPAVMAIAPISQEPRLGRVGGIMHNASHIAAQTGFAAVWDSKNLKAVSFTGAQSFTVADPNALMNLRREVACPEKTALRQHSA